ncbi:hypothetical protein A0H81_03904 [Grifola frondosa]|uniref:Uncharacterized protein n=1 Tax=Grifola frondosa TaxID=5627 RepID=A0A1C7MGW6_GRIFR|nr:hypothetical protein A0H81_03904 [Grifola frondosa]
MDQLEALPSVPVSMDPRHLDQLFDHGWQKIFDKVFELIRRGNGPYADWFLNVDEDRRAAADILEGQVCEGVREIMRRSTVIAAICECIPMQEPRIAEEDVPTIDCYVAFATAAAMSRRVWLAAPSLPSPTSPPKPHRRRERSSLGMGASIHPARRASIPKSEDLRRKAIPSTPRTQTPVRRSVAMRLGTDSPSVILAHSSGSSDVFLNPEDAANAPIPRLFQRHAEEPDF